MSAKPLMLEGIVEEPQEFTNDTGRKEIEALHGEVRMLRREVEDLREERDRLARGIENLRHILSPIHRAVRVIFGEIELAIGEEPAAASTNSSAPSASASDPRWESYKKQFQGAPTAVIDALLIHGPMKITNLASLLKRHYNTIDGAVTKLKNAGAVTRDGGVISLRK